MKQITAH